MMYPRRTIVKGAAALVAASALPRRAMALLGARPEPVPPIEDPRLKKLTDASLDAARKAGANYADARLTFTETMIHQINAPIREETMHFGVRALVDGYWGFASSPVWNIDEAARLGEAAVRQARANHLGQEREVNLVPLADMTSGHWTMPVKDDPFAIHPHEIRDYLYGLQRFIMRQKYIRRTMVGGVFVRQERAFASTEGQFCTQRLYRTQGTVYFSLEHEGKGGTATLMQVTPAGKGFEHLRDQPLRDYVMQEHASIQEDWKLPVKPIDVGRYDILLDSWAMSGLVSQTVGAASELDRALGYEANAGGTSYITDPNEMIGTFKVGSSLVSITGNRSEPGGAGTVHWDDEGVRPRDFTLVNNGVLQDMQTMREGAGWLASYYQRKNLPLASHGCAYADNAMSPPLTHCANLSLRPSSDDAATYATLLAGMEKGIAFKRAFFSMDFQQVTGMGTGEVSYEVKNGKRTAVLADAGMIFRTPELWNGIVALGGATSAERFGHVGTKGEPAQQGYHSVTAPPAVIKDMTIIDVKRKA
jgi:TldD protein